MYNIETNQFYINTCMCRSVIQQKLKKNQIIIKLTFKTQWFFCGVTINKIDAIFKSLAYTHIDREQSKCVPFKQKLHIKYFKKSPHVLASM